MRCSSCGKFVEVDCEDEPRVELEVEVDKDDPGMALVSGSIEIVNHCAECGQDLAQALFDADVQIPIKHAEDCTGADLVLDHDASRFDEFLPPGARRQKHMYGVEVSVTVECQGCGAKAEGSFRDSVQSSHMEEC